MQKDNERRVKGLNLARVRLTQTLVQNCTVNRPYLQ